MKMKSTITFPTPTFPPLSAASHPDRLQHHRPDAVRVESSSSPHRPDAVRVANHRELIADMNVLVDKYNALIAARKRSRPVSVEDLTASNN